MAGIPWWAWLGVGLLVTLVSSRVGGKIAWFAWIGWLFIIIGIIKGVIHFILRKEVSKFERKYEQPIHPTRPAQPQHYQPQYYYCPNCRTTIHPYDVYCRNCGTRLK